MRANSKVAILVVSMFVLTALAPAVTVFCGSDSAEAETAPTVRGVNTSEVLAFTETTGDFRSLMYLSDEFPTNDGQDMTDWVYDSTNGYWVNNNELSENYGNVLTYKYFSMTTDEIKQDIVDKYYRNNIIDENGNKYIVSGSTILIGSGLAYNFDTSTKEIKITLGSGWSVFAAYDVVGRDITVPGLTGSTVSVTFDNDGDATVYDSATPMIEFAYKLILSDGSMTYIVARNVDQSNAKFQLLQTSFYADSQTDVRIDIKKATAADVSTSINADMSFADCYFSKLQYTKLYVIDTYDGDIKPLQVNGTYNVTINDINNGTSEIKEAKIGNSFCFVYGTVTTSEGTKTGATVTDAIYGAKITYSVTEEGGATNPHTATVSDVTDENGQIQGFFRMEAKINSTIQITEVECPGYSFKDKTYNVGKLTGDISPSETECIFKAVEKRIQVTVTDQTGAPAANCTIKAEWWYQYNNVVSKEYPSSAGGSKGTLPLDTFTTDANGSAWISFSEPTGVDQYLLLAWCKSEKDDTYTFQLDDTSTWPSNPTLPTSLTKEGNVIVAASAATCGTLMKAVEYSFTVTVGAANNSVSDPRTLEGAGLVANWYYRGQGATDKNSTKIDFSLLTGESVGKVKLATEDTDENGVIRVVYATPVFDPIRWDDFLSSCFIYIYGTEYKFDYVKDIADLTTDPDVSGHPGCLMLKFTGTDPPGVFSGNKDIKSSDSLYRIGGTIAAHTGEVPYAVRMVVTFVETGAPSSIDRWYYRSGSTVTYEFSMIGGWSPIIEMFSDGYSFTNISPSVTTVVSDRTVNFISDYTGSTSIAREAAVPIGKIGGYIVSVLEAGDIVRYNYMVGGLPHTTMVKATLISSDFGSIYVVKGRAGMSVTMTATDVDDKYYISKFVDGTVPDTAVATTVKLKETYNFMYKGDETNILAGYSIDIYYKGELYYRMTSDALGIAKVKIPDDETNIKYYYEGFVVTPDATPPEKYTGYYTFNLENYVSKNVLRTIKVTIEYYATSSIDNLSAATCKRIVYDGTPTTADIAVGSVKVFMAPELDGFSFAGWYFDGQYYSDSDKKSCSFTATGSMDDNVTLRAYYSAATVEEADKGIDSTVMIIGIIAIVVAVLALVYVVFQSKRF